MDKFTLFISYNHWKEDLLEKLQAPYAYYTPQRLTELWLEEQSVQHKTKHQKSIFVFSDQELSLQQLMSNMMENDSYLIYELKEEYTYGELEVLQMWEKEGKLLLLRSPLVEEDILKQVKGWLQAKQNRQRKRIISFMSPISNIGLSFITLMIAKMFAQQTRLKVCLLSLNLWDDNTSFIQNYTGKHLDEIKNIVQHGLFQDKEFIQLFHQESANLYVLAGNRQIHLERMYTITELKQIIFAAERAFDLVLIDAGCHYDNAGLFAALSTADTKILLTNQQVKAWTKFNYQYEQVLSQLGYLKNDFWLIINQYQQHAELPTSRDLIKRYGVAYLCTIPHLNYGMVQEYLFNVDQLDEKGLEQAVRIVVKAIAQKYNLFPFFNPTVLPMSKRRWASGLFSILGGEKFGGA